MTTKFTAAIWILICAVTTVRAAETFEFLAKDAKMTKAGLLKYESEPQAQNIGGWNSTNAAVSWSAPEIPKGTYRVIVVYAMMDGYDGGKFEVSAGNQRANLTVRATGGWTNFIEEDVGPIIFRKTGPVEITGRCTSIPRRYGINLRAIKLVPEP